MQIQNPYAGKTTILQAAFPLRIHRSRNLSFETERIRREVAASLEDWRIDEARIEAEMSAEEAFDVEAFDVDAYR